VNKKRATAPTNNFYPPEREKKKKEKKKKKGYTLQTAREVTAVKVFWQNTTRSATRCGDCGKNTKCATFTDGKRNGYLCIFIFFGGKYLIQKVLIFIRFLFWYCVFLLILGTMRTIKTILKI